LFNRGALCFGLLYQFKVFHDAKYFGMITFLIAGKQSSGRFLVCITGCASVGRIMESEVLRINDLMFIPLFGESVDRNAFSEVCIFVIQDVFQSAI